LQPVQANDVGVAAQVLAMTGAALTGTAIGHQPVITVMLAQIGSHVLVTGEAQLR